MAAPDGAGLSTAAGKRRLSLSTRLLGCVFAAALGAGLVNDALAQPKPRDPYNFGARPSEGRDKLESRDLFMTISVPDAGDPITAGPASSSILGRGDRKSEIATGNWFERWIVQLQGMLGADVPTSGRRRTGTGLGDSFSDLDDYQDIYVLAAGWNGDRFYQYRLGLMFENGAYPVQPNLSAAYYWYCLAAAQGLDVAQRQRRQLLAAHVDGELDAQDLNEVFLKVIEVYIYGGTEAQFRLGELLESDFFNNQLHDQDALRVDGNSPRRRIIYAYAAYLLAGQGGYEQADYALQNLLTSYNLTQVELDTGERVAERWGSLVGISEDPENPFIFTPGRVAEALERGSAFQERRSDPLLGNDQALSWLRSGQAFQARGDVRSSKIAFETAIRVEPNSRAAMHAQQQLQRLSTTCSAAPFPERKGYEARSPYPPAHPLSRVREIRIAAQQRALEALGFYDGAIDDVPGKMTRMGFRLFLSSLNLDEKDFLDAPQVVELICMAAQLRGHAPSQNVLGVMYAEGIGVVQDQDLAHYWFGEAVHQGDPSAIFNMGMMYAQERGLPFKNHPQSCQIASSYLKEAAELNHPGARRALNRLRNEPACRGKQVRRDTDDDGEEQGA